MLGSAPGAWLSTVSTPFSTIPAVFPHVPPPPNVGMPYDFRLAEVLRLLIELKIRALKDEKMRLEWSLNDLEGYDNDNDCNYIPEENELAYTAVRKQINKLEAEISSAEGSIANLTAEMRYKVRRMFPNPVGKTPKRALRQQEAV